MKRLYTEGFLFLVLVGLLISLALIGADAQSKQSQQSPSDAATVVVHFDGLQVIGMGSREYYTSAFLNAPQHQAELKIIKVGANGARSVTHVLKGDELASILTIGVEGGISAPVSKFTPGMQTSEHDLDWAIDLEQLFNRKLTIDKSKLSGFVVFSIGQFYADRLTEESWQFRAGSQRLPFQRRVAEPAVAVSLTDGQALVIKRDGQRVARLTGDRGVRWEIEISNLPTNTDMMSVDHFQHYYSILNEPVTPYLPVIIKKAAYLPRPLLCDTVIIGSLQLP